MKKTVFEKTMALLLAVLLVGGMLPLDVLAAGGPIPVNAGDVLAENGGSVALNAGQVGYVRFPAYSEEDGVDVSVQDTSVVTDAAVVTVVAGGETFDALMLAAGAAGSTEVSVTYTVIDGAGEKTTVPKTYTVTVSAPAPEPAQPVTLAMAN